MNANLRSLALGLVLAALAPLAQGAQIQTSAPLAGSNENPVVVTPGTGVAFVSLDTTTHQLRVTVTFSGLTTNDVAAHIHCCIAPPANVGVATAVPAFPGFPLGVTSGGFDQTFDTSQAAIWNPAFIAAHGGTPLGAEATLAAGLAIGQAYLNIHTTANPGGEIRGFLAPQSVGPNNTGFIPTLSEWGLAILAAILAAAAFLVLRRRVR